MLAASFEQWELCSWLIGQKIDVKYLTPDRNSILHILANQRENLKSDTTPPFMQVNSLNLKMNNLEIWN